MPNSVLQPTVLALRARPAAERGNRKWGMPNKRLHLTRAPSPSLPSLVHMIQVARSGEPKRLGITGPKQPERNEMSSTVPTIKPRPWWMTAVAVICVAGLVIWIPRDLFVPNVRDVEVWLGFELRGHLALLTAPLHWAIFAFGAWAFWTARPWIVPWAAGYIFYGAMSHLIWSEVSPNGRGWPIGLAQAIAISLFGLLLLRAARRNATGPLMGGTLDGPRKEEGRPEWL